MSTEYSESFRTSGGRLVRIRKFGDHVELEIDDIPVELQVDGFNEFVDFVLQAKKEIGK